MKLDRKTINVTQLKNSASFRNYMQWLLSELELARETYENTAPASEFLRGRVSVLRDLISAITDESIR